MSEVLFWLSSVVAVVSALGIVFSPQAAQSAFWMFAELLGISGIMAALGAYLLSLVTLLVYAGAILVLFIFVIMFMGQRLPIKQIGGLRLAGALLAAAFVVVLLLPLIFSPTHMFPSSAAGALTHTELYGSELFGRYQLLTQMGAWVLLWVGVGAFNINGRRDEI
jgi:NADH-quinone oxidoreductase subunit J